MAKAPPQSNWVIAIGYILVASIILLNYIAQRTESRQAKVRTMLSGQQSETPVGNSDTESLQKQLEEERRVRREMSEMLNRLQRGYAANPQASTELEASIPTNGNNVPDLREGLLSTTRPLGPPPSGRNPFLPFFSQPSNPIAVETPQQSSISISRLRSNPTVPLPLTGTWLPIKVYGDTR